MGLQREVYDAMDKVHRGHASASRLGYNPDTRRLEVTGRGNNPDHVKPLNHQDMDLYCTPVIVLDGSRIRDGIPGNGGLQVEFAAKDNETVFSTLAGVSGQSETIATNPNLSSDLAEVRVPLFFNRSITTKVWVRHGQVLILGGDAYRAGVEVALPHHFAAHCQQWECPKAESFGAQQCRYHYVAPGAHSAVGLQHNSLSLSVGNQGMVRLGDAELPRGSSVLD